jgi:cell division protease FtsH
MTFFKRLLRGPLIYILVAIAAVWIGSSLLSASGFQQITTDEGLTFLKNKAVSEATIVDVENRVDLTLTQHQVKLLQFL